MDEMLNVQILNMNIGDPIMNFEQQASVLLEKSRGVGTVTQSLHMSALNGSTSIVVDNIYNRINSVEEKLNSCDSIYRLATQANTTTDKQKREQFQSFVNKANEIDSRISRIDGRTLSIDQIIRETVHNEMEKFNKANEMNSQINKATKELTDRLTEIEAQYIDNSKKSNKEMKKLKIEVQMAKTNQKQDGRVDEIVAQLSELKRRQTMMLELLTAFQSKNFPDFQNVNSQIQQLYEQLSTTKKVDSPLKYKL